MAKIEEVIDIINDTEAIAAIKLRLRRTLVHIDPLLSTVSALVTIFNQTSFNEKGHLPTAMHNFIQQLQEKN